MKEIKRERKVYRMQILEF